MLCNLESYINIMTTIEKLKQILNEPVTYKLPEKEMDLFLSKMTVQHFSTDEDIILEGTVNRNLYILQEGIIRGVFDKGEEKETTIYFGVEGDYFLSMNSFLDGEPSFISVQACSDCTVLVITHDCIQQLTRESTVFSNWILENSLRQIMALEMKRKFLKGDALTKYRALIDRRPDIMFNVPLKYIASYLGITQQSLSRLRSSKYKK